MSTNDVNKHLELILPLKISKQGGGKGHLVKEADGETLPVGCTGCHGWLVGAQLTAQRLEGT